MTARVLEAGLKDPILESHISWRFAALKGAEKSDERISTMKQLSELAAISAVLLDLNVSELLWKPASFEAAPRPSMHGAGSSRLNRSHERRSFHEIGPAHSVPDPRDPAITVQVSAFMKGQRRHDWCCRTKIAVGCVGADAMHARRCQSPGEV